MKKPTSTDAMTSKRAFSSASIAPSAVPRSARKKRLRMHPRTVSSWFPPMLISSARFITSTFTLSGPDSMRLERSSSMSTFRDYTIPVNIWHG